MIQNLDKSYLIGKKLEERIQIVTIIIKDVIS